MHLLYRKESLQTGVDLSSPSDVEQSFASSRSNEALRIVLEVEQLKEMEAMKKTQNLIISEISRFAPILFAKAGDLFDVCLANHNRLNENCVLCRGVTFVFDRIDFEEDMLCLDLHPSEGILSPLPDNNNNNARPAQRGWFECGEVWQIFGDAIDETTPTNSETIDDLFHEAFDLRKLRVKTSAAGLFKVTPSIKLLELEENREIDTLIRGGTI